VSWQGLNFDFTGVLFDGGDFPRARFPSGDVSFEDAEFSGGNVSFEDVEFSGSEVSFAGAEFSGGEVNFYGAEFSGGTVSFNDTKFSGSAAAPSASTTPSFRRRSQLQRRQVFRHHGGLQQPSRLVIPARVPLDRTPPRA
jgi:hypothetical protein